MDAIIFGSTNNSLCEDFVHEMHEEFEMSIMRVLNYFLGVQVKHMDHGTFLHQTKYCKELLKKFEMDKSKEATSPMATNCYLSADEKGKSINQTKYKGIIGSLHYLTASRLDIMFGVCMCAHYQSSPKESHFSIVKRIMKYQKGTLDVGLWYPKGVEISLVGYSNLDFVGRKLDTKSTSGTYHLLGDDLVYGIVRSKHVLPYPWLRLRLNILLLGVVVHKSCGLNNNFLTLDCIYNTFL